LSALGDLGVRLVLDDFGTGYSSLSQLRDLPLDALKIDRSFVAGICTEAADRAIVEAIVSMAAALRLEVVAEGVETAEQLHVLEDLGCDLLQGYFLGRPLPAEDLDGLLRVAPRGPRGASSGLGGGALRHGGRHPALQLGAPVPGRETAA
jgi:EAL domain-containing protein (putative c-di-GMP-specific phosphodiesterase class I)